MIIGPGITIGGGIYVDSNAPPSGIVTNGLTLYLDAGNLSSYPGSGATWYDISGNTADVTLYNNPTFAAGPPKRLDFDGSQFGIASKTGLLSSTAYTKSAWFFWTGYAYNNNIVSGSAGGHFMFGSGTDHIYCGHSDWGNYNAFPSVATISLLTWYNITLTFNTTDGMALYINGTLDNTYVDNKNPLPGNGSTEIASYDGGNNMAGGISQVQCYSRSITASEVLQNFNATRSSYGI